MHRHSLTASVASRSHARLIAAVLALLAGVGVTAAIAGGSGGSEPASHGAGTALPPIHGPHVTLGKLVYAVTDVRLLDVDRPADAPYLVNLERPPRGSAYLGVFIRVYNRGRRPVPSAVGFLLEPTKQPGLVLQDLSSQSPYQLQLGKPVPARGTLPVPGSAAAAGPVPGGLLLYVISGAQTRNQPLDVVINGGGHLGRIRLPRVPQLSGSGHEHGH